MAETIIDVENTGWSDEAATARSEFEANQRKLTKGRELLLNGNIKADDFRTYISSFFYYVHKELL